MFYIYIYIYIYIYLFISKPLIFLVFIQFLNINRQFMMCAYDHEPPVISDSIFILQKIFPFSDKPEIQELFPQYLKQFTMGTLDKLLGIIKNLNQNENSISISNNKRFANEQKKNWIEKLFNLCIGEFMNRCIGDM